MGKGLSIPLNEKGVNEYDYGVLESENLIFMDGSITEYVCAYGNNGRNQRLKRGI